MFNQKPIKIMNEIIKLLESNSKVNNINKKVKPSLSDEVEYEFLRVVFNTNRNLVEYAKSFILFPTDRNNKFKLVLYVGCDNPNKTLLAEIYNRCKIEDWKPAKYGHDRPEIRLMVGIDEIRQITNYVYSKIN